MMFNQPMLIVVLICVMSLGLRMERTRRRPDGPYHGLPHTPYHAAPMAVLGGVFLAFAVIAVLLGTQRSFQIFLSMVFQVLLLVCVYYLILIPLLPLLRRYLSSNATAVLWALPYYLYFPYYFIFKEPVFFVRVPKGLVYGLLAVWLVGMVVVLARSLLDHVWFYRHVLRDAVPCNDPAVKTIWEQEIKLANIPKLNTFPVVSPVVTTPMSVGLTRRRIRVVLPEQSYTPEELELIFRHELIHIMSSDSQVKLGLAVFKAMCWFNPLMWVAVQRCSEDLELSCDEAVLTGEDETTRLRYANLILKTAGDERGFTTCLSASAQSLRYRLRRIVHPKVRWAGGVVVALVLCGLAVLRGAVCLVYDEGTLQDFLPGDPGQYVLRDVSVGSRAGICIDPERALSLMTDLPVEVRTGGYIRDYEHTGVFFNYVTPDGPVTIALRNNEVIVEPSGKVYALPQGVDWETMDSLLKKSVTMELYTEQGHYWEQGETALTKVTRIQNGEAVDVTSGFRPEIPVKQCNYRVHACKVMLPEQTQRFVVTVAPWDGSAPYSIPGSKLEQSDRFVLHPTPADYTVTADLLEKDGTIYRMEYSFGVEASAP